MFLSHLNITIHGCRFKTVNLRGNLCSIKPRNTYRKTFSTVIIIFFFFGLHSSHCEIDKQTCPVFFISTPKRFDVEYLIQTNIENFKVPSPSVCGAEVIEMNYQDKIFWTCCKLQLLLQELLQYTQGCRVWKQLNQFIKFPVRQLYDLQDVVLSVSENRFPFLGAREIEEDTNPHQVVRFFEDHHMYK